MGVGRRMIIALRGGRDETDRRRTSAAHTQAVPGHAALSVIALGELDLKRNASSRAVRTVAAEYGHAESPNRTRIDGARRGIDSRRHQLPIAGVVCARNLAQVSAVVIASRARSVRERSRYSPSRAVLRFARSLRAFCLSVRGFTNPPIGQALAFDGGEKTVGAHGVVNANP